MWWEGRSAMRTTGSDFWPLAAAIAVLPAGTMGAWAGASRRQWVLVDPFSLVVNYNVASFLLI